MTRALPRLIALLALLALAGCQTNTSPPAGQGDPVPPPINDPQISVLEASLRQWLFFHPAVVVHEERVMRVEVPVRNRAPREYQVEYRILFYDDLGRELEPPMGWQHVPMDPNQIVRMKGNSLDGRAESYRLEVRWAR